MNVKQTMVKYAPAWIKRFLLRLLFDEYANRHYSQEGEDIILQRIFFGKARGFYVDVGAHHPRRFSNTYVFYRQGWTGINIEPNPDQIKLFRKERGRDVNLQLGVDRRDGILTYYLFDEPALNTFDGGLAAQREAATPYRVLETRQVPVQRLDAILKQYLPPNTEIDFLTIDVEGLDLAVLQSNDWGRYRPTCVLVESIGTSVEQAMGGEIFEFLQAKGYELYAKAYNTLIFRTRDAAGRKTKAS